uniref:ATPase AAA-type core domain-containing protein n=1 Tax=viral metagenome TaxID=1070528 RepID=A0A6C0EC34_9ZZZZ
MSNNIVCDMIKHIEYLYETDNPLIERFANLNMLYDALHDLNEVVGMDEIKGAIIKIIKFLIIDLEYRKSTNFDGHMLHTVIYGNPGVGKTLIGSILAKIWGGIGILKPAKSPPKTDLQNELIDRIAKLTIMLKKIDVKESSTQTDMPIEEFKKLPIYRYDSDAVYRRHKIPLLSVPIQKQRDQYYTLQKYDLPQKPLVKKKEVAQDEKPQVEIPKEPPKKKLNRTHFTPPLIIISRNDLVGQYMGHSSEKTNSVLNEALQAGKAVFIDEAYSLVHDEKDSFGHEAINELNLFMSTHPELIIIFAGYKDKIESTLFTYQKGFKRRCKWVFEISNYTPKMLTKIFKKQMESSFWKVDIKDEDLDAFFEKNKNNFESFAGDTEKLSFCCKLEYACLRFDDIYSTQELKKTIYKTINKNILLKAYEDYKSNMPNKENELLTYFS